MFGWAEFLEVERRYLIGHYGLSLGTVVFVSCGLALAAPLLLLLRVVHHCSQFSASASAHLDVSKKSIAVLKLRWIIGK